MDCVTQYEGVATCERMALALGHMFLEDESQSLAMLSDFIGKPVSLAVETAHNQEKYDIILM